MKYKKWLIILGSLPILVIFAGIFKFDVLSNLENHDVDGNKIKKELSYYDKLKKDCEQKDSKSCCLSSVEHMEKNKFKLAVDDNCKFGYKRNLMRCIDTFVWCEKEEENKNEVCDEDGNRYRDSDEAKWVGLKDSEFGATYCPEYKMHSSWDTNKDGVNDCYEDDSCSKKLDYMSPRIKKDETKERMVVKIPTWEFNEQKNDFITTFKKYNVLYTPAILNSTLKKLFEVKGGDSNGAWNGLKFDSVSINNGVATIKLSGNWYPVGDMSGAYFSHEIEAATFQFSTVKDLRVYVNGEIFDWCIDSEAEPEESGCDKKKMLWDTTL